MDLLPLHPGDYGPSFRVVDTRPNLFDQLGAESFQREVALHYRREARKAKWLGRFGFANRAGRASTEPQSSFRLGLSATIAIACVALSLLAVAYFAWQFLGRPGL
jgi:hypothetical protein